MPSSTSTVTCLTSTSERHRSLLHGATRSHGDIRREGRELQGNRTVERGFKRVPNSFPAYLAGKRPRSTRWFSSVRLAPLLSGGPDPRGSSKCGGSGCIVYSIGGLQQSASEIHSDRAPPTWVRGCAVWVADLGCGESLRVSVRPGLSSSGAVGCKALPGKIWAHRDRPSSVLKERCAVRMSLVPSVYSKDGVCRPARGPVHQAEVWVHSRVRGSPPCGLWLLEPEEEKPRASLGVALPSLNSSASVRRCKPTQREQQTKHRLGISAFSHVSLHFLIVSRPPDVKTDIL